MIRLIDISKSDTVLEIGPGLGALTSELAKRCKTLYAVEKDRKIYGLAKDLLSADKNLDIFLGDFLDFDIGGIPSRNIKVAGALPFYITTPIIQRLLDFKEKIDVIYIVVQKEVAQRFVARQNEKEYSSLSLFVQTFSKIEPLMNIKKNSFFPVPKVDSAFVKMTILDTPSVNFKDEETYFKVIRQSFQQRRKTLSSSLSHKGALGIDKNGIAEILKRLGIDPKRRPETLAPEEFAGISDGVVDFLS